MNQKPLRELEDYELAALYRKSAIDHGLATLNGDYKSANKAADNLRSIYQEMKVREIAPVLIRQLISDPNTSVQVWSSTHLLPFQPDIAVGILEEIASGPPSPFRLDADMVLRQWKNGKLDL